MQDTSIPKARNSEPAYAYSLEEINRMQAVLAEVRPQSSLWLHSLGYDGAKFRASAGRTTMAQ